MGGKKHQCSSCGKVFQSPSHLLLHMRVHTGERPFPCDLCDKAFAEKGSLEKHKRKHSGAKPFQCGVCKRAFSQSSNLQTHKLVHSGAKPFKCPQCSKSFNRRSNLKKHQNVHLEVKPYQCDICRKGFNFRANLWSHKKRHHGGEENVECQDCGQVIYPGWVPPSRCAPGSYSRLLYGDYFQTIADLHQNMKDYLGPLADKCFDCGAEFLAKSRAEGAAVINEGRQMTECLFCEKRLPPGDLESHTRMHTGE